MADDRLGVKQRAALLTLMAEAREVSNTELKELVGFTLDGKDRRKLNDLNLVDSRVGARRVFVHDLTDAGWRWCADELSASRPPASGSLGAALYRVLANFRRHLSRSNLRLADVFGREQDEVAPPGAEAGPVPDLEMRVRAAYKELAAEPRAWVSLTELRPLLDDVAKADVDATLRSMLGRPGISLVPESNQKTLSGDDRAAAVRIGARDHHLVSIDEL